MKTLHSVRTHKYILLKCIISIIFFFLNMLKVLVFLQGYDLFWLIFLIHLFYFPKEFSETHLRAAHFRQCSSTVECWWYSRMIKWYTINEKEFMPNPKLFYQNSSLKATCVCNMFIYYIPLHGISHKHSTWLKMALACSD